MTLCTSFPTVDSFILIFCIFLYIISYYYNFFPPNMTTREDSTTVTRRGNRKATGQQIRSGERKVAGADPGNKSP